MGLNRQIVLIYSVGLLMFGCNTPNLTSSVEEKAKHQSVNNFYNAGMIRCSVDNISFDEVCDYAVYKEKKSPIRVVIESVAVKTSIKYRVLYFTSKGFISKNKKDVIHFHKTESNHYQINIGRENYLLPIRTLQYQPDIEDDTSKDKPKENTLDEYKAPQKEEESIQENSSVEPTPKATTTPVKAQPIEPKGTKRKFKR
jgi:hypothetical protein